MFEQTWQIVVVAAVGGTIVLSLLIYAWKIEFQRRRLQTKILKLQVKILEKQLADLENKQDV